jgi:hypothetical protein
MLNLKIKSLSEKLDFKKIGLFRLIKKVLILNYELALLVIILLVLVTRFYPLNAAVSATGLGSFDRLHSLLLSLTLI